ncbi:WD40 repeat domain-containing protein [Kordia sp.]|uniref:WD40 repeat domain-containing protein n=1 Tax=Kordia sp. TaxID=1965332 RepID=UPI003B5C20A9
MSTCSEALREDFSPRVFSVAKNKLLSNSSNANTLYLQDKQDKNDLKIFSYNGNGVVTATTDTAYKRIAISYYINEIHVYNVQTLDMIKKIELEAKSSVLSLQEDALLYGLDNGLVKAYNFINKKEKTIATHKDIVRGIAVLKDGTILSMSSDGELKITHPTKKSEQKVFPKVLSSMAVSPNEKIIAIAAFDGTVYLLNKNYKTVAELAPHTSVITQIKFRNNEELITASFDKKLVNTDITTKKMTVMYTAKDYIMAFDMSTDKLIFSDRSGNVRYYNLKCQ